MTGPWEEEDTHKGDDIEDLLSQLLWALGGFGVSLMVLPMVAAWFWGFFAAVVPGCWQ